jgi:hypothetical protein
MPDNNCMTRLTAIILASVLLLGSGCEEPEVVQPEPKRADDRLTQAEIDSFLAIVESLPDRKLPQLPSVMLPAPEWSRNRTLPVNELVKEEEKALLDHKSIEWFVGHFPQSRFLKRALRRERLTIEQFVGLYLALGTTLSRERLPGDRDLDQILIRGKRAIGELLKDQRIFSSLPEEQAYFLHEQSGWLAVVDRASRLKLVHPDNLALVRENEVKLRAILPAEFNRNPLQEFATILDDRGVPFQELAGQETDDRIGWSRERALVGGTDAANDEESR